MKLKHCFQRAAAVIACLMLLCTTVFAAERPSYTPLTADQLGTKCTLIINYLDNGNALPETTFNIYRIAEIKENLHFGLVAPFDQYPANWDINSAGYNDWATLAGTLSGLVAQNQPNPAAPAVTTNANGQATFTNLDTGLYLLIGNTTNRDGQNYTPTPAMISLPSWNANSGDWDFTPVANIKHTSQATDTVRALKIWNDAGYESRRPESVEVYLLENGAISDTVTLNAANNWGYTWEGLDTESSWTVSENVPAGYRVSIEQTGLTFTVTNTYITGGGGGGGGGTPTPPGPGPNPTNPTNPTPPEVNIDPTEPPRAEIDVEDPQTPLGVIDPPATEEVSIGEDPVPQGEKNLVDVEDPFVPLAIKLPQTGQLWWPVPVLAAAGVILIAVGLKRRQGASEQA